MKDNGFLVVLGGGTFDEYFTVNDWIELGDKALMKVLKPQVGGTYLNAATIAASLGTPTKIYEVMEEDTKSTAFLTEHMDQMGINRELVLYSPKATNSRALIILTPSGERCVFVTEQDRAGIFCEAWNEDITKAKFVYIMGSTVDAFDGAHGLITKAKESGAWIVCDCDSNFDNPHTLQTIENVDVAIFNRLSYRRLSDKLGQPVAPYLFQKGVKILYCTNDADGVSVYTPDGVQKDFAGFKVKVLDTTGAGDSFSGAIIYALDSGMNPFAAGAFANATASRAVTKLGAAGGACTPPEVEQFMADFGRLDEIK